MRRPRLNEEIVRRIENALDERKGDRRSDREEREPAPERRNRSRRKQPDPAIPREGTSQPATPPGT